MRRKQSDIQKTFDRGPDTKEKWHERLLLRNTGGAEYSLVNGALFLPKAEAIEVSCYCPTCSKPLRGTKPQIWFGDWVCGQCFEKFSGREPK